MRNLKCCAPTIQLRFLGTVLLVLCWAQSTPGEESSDLDALRQEIQVLKEALEEVRTEVDAIKNRLRLQIPKPFRPVAINIGGDPSKGDKAAKVTIVDFSDYQCPFCARYVRETLPQIERDYVQTGKVRYVFKDLPIESIHKDAFKAHEAANCAGEQGKYWEMHRILFANQKALAPENLAGYAKSIGLDEIGFRQCLSTGKYAEEIRKDIAQGASAGVRGTPSFLVGFTEPGGDLIKAVVIIRGAQPYRTFRETIEKLLVDLPQ